MDHRTGKIKIRPSFHGGVNGRLSVVAVNQSFPRLVYSNETRPICLSMNDLPRGSTMFKKLLISSVAAVAMTTSALAADIIDTANEAGSFTTLIAAVEAAGLRDTLK